MIPTFKKYLSLSLDMLKNYHLPIILMGFFLMYLPGIFMAFGRDTLSGDELHVVNSVLKFFRDFHFSDPYAYAFPVMTIIYVICLGLFFLGCLWVGVIDNVSDLENLVILSPEVFMPVFRLVTIILSICVLFVTYKISKIIFRDYRYAVISLFLTGLSFIFVKNSFIALKWIPQLLVMMVFLWWIFYIDRQNKVLKLKDYFLAGVMLVASYGIALVGLVMILPFILLLKDLYRKNLLGNWKIGLLLFSLITTLGCISLSLMVPDLTRSSFSFASDVVLTGYGENIRTELPGYRFWGYLDQLIKADILVTFLAVLGVFGFYKYRRQDWEKIMSVIVVYYIMLGPVMGAIRQRRLVVLIPFMSILAIAGIIFLSRGNKIIEKILTVLVVLLMSSSLVLILIEVDKDDSKLLARNWVESNLPVDSVVYDECLLGLKESRNFILTLKDGNQIKLTTRQNYIINRSMNVKEKDTTFNVVSDTSLLPKIGEKLKQSNNQFFVFCFNSKPGTVNYYDELREQLEYFDLGIDNEFMSRSEIVYDSSSIYLVNSDHYHYLINQVDPLYLLGRLRESYSGDHVRIFKIK